MNTLSIYIFVNKFKGIERWYCRRNTFKSAQTQNNSKGTVLTSSKQLSVL